jgi:hypothetical protein
MIRIEHEGSVFQVGHGKARDPVGKQLDAMSRHSFSIHARSSPSSPNRSSTEAISQASSPMSAAPSLDAQRTAAAALRNRAGGRPERREERAAPRKGGRLANEVSLPKHAASACAGRSHRMDGCLLDQSKIDCDEASQHLHSQ